jgi:23S rRNA pseudouridine1911/1915/1917 synthase
MAVVTRGRTRESVTVYRSIASFGSASPCSGCCTLIEAEPQTARTHQIRVDLAFPGFPVVGDAIYGTRKNALGLTRQFLRAWKLEFTLPRENRRAQFVAPLPEDLRGVLSELRFDLRALE